MRKVARRRACSYHTNKPRFRQGPRRKEFRFPLLRLIVLWPVFLISCRLATSLLPPSPPPTLTVPVTARLFPTTTASSSPTPAATVTAIATATATPRSPLPDLAHILVVVLENREFGSVIGRSEWSAVNRWAQEYALLTQYYAITHPSLPNYIAMMGGDTFGIHTNCRDCFINAPSLPDQLETAGYRWKGYFEDMPRPCYLGDTATYVQKHNPFLYFDPIRTVNTRCAAHVVPLTQLETDLATEALPDFAFIIPNQCHNGHDCSSAIADAWLETWVNRLLNYLEAHAAQEPYLLIITWEEGQGNHSCCGLPPEAGGRVPLLLISPLVRKGFQDDTPYTHYSLLKTIELAWNLPYLGHAADEGTAPILAVWK